MASRSRFHIVASVLALSMVIAVSSGLPLGAQALGAGGGEPGAAYLACQVHVQKQSRDGLLACVSGERADELEAMTEAEAKEMLEFIQMLQPTDIKVTGGSMDGNTATLEAEGQQEGAKATATITMVKEGGTWKIQKESWSSS